MPCLRAPRRFGSRFLPGRVLGRQADGAGAVAGGDRGLLVEEEDAVLDVAASGDHPGGAGAVEAAVDPRAAVAAEGARHLALVRLAVTAEQGPGPAHRF